MFTDLDRLQLHIDCLATAVHVLEMQIVMEDEGVVKQGLRRNLEHQRATLAGLCERLAAMETVACV